MHARREKASLASLLRLWWGRKLVRSCKSRSCRVGLPWRISPFNQKLSRRLLCRPSCLRTKASCKLPMLTTRRVGATSPNFRRGRTRPPMWASGKMPHPSSFSKQKVPITAKNDAHYEKHKPKGKRQPAISPGSAEDHKKEGHQQNERSSCQPHIYDRRLEESSIITSHRVWAGPEYGHHSEFIQSIHKHRCRYWQITGLKDQEGNQIQAQIKPISSE